MKRKLQLLKAVLALIALVAALIAPPATKAADYAVQKTAWDFAGTWTNVVGAVTNLNAAVDCTQFTDFALQVVFTGTNAAMTTTLGYTLAWQSSVDGSNWGTVDNHSRGWFSIPTTNAITTVWDTNITLNAKGYWRIAYATNSSGQCITNLAIKAYVKPKRTARDQ